LQARQLRSAQIQSTAASQIELIKFGLDYPAIAGELIGVDNPNDFTKEVALNWHMSHLETSYLNRTVSEKHLRNTVALLFSTDFARGWWEREGESYDDAATSRREREFYAIVNAEFERSKLASKRGDTGAALPDKPLDSSSPSS
jgi:hypothetical protein